MTVRNPISHPNPQVSVAIPTLPENEYEPPDLLRSQTFDRYEVIVVSDAELNRCEARNKGIEAANGDIIAQTDDDCIPPKTWIEKIYNHFDKKPQPVIVEGPLDKHKASQRNYIGANMAYQRDLALNIGGFDSELNGWRADTDFGWRMEKEYGPNRSHYDPELEVKHQGPLRTNVNRELEREFRARHPRKYFTVLDHPNSKIGTQTGRVAAMMYSLVPGATERIVRLFE